MTNKDLKIRKIRSQKDFTQEYLAYMLDISQKSYSDIENGKTKLRCGILYKISKILDVSPHEICPISKLCNHNKQKLDIENKYIDLIKYLIKNDIDIPIQFLKPSEVESV